MNKLLDKFDDILNDSLIYWEEVDFEKHNRECVEECKKIAIEFAKSLMDSEVTEQRSGKIGQIGNTVNAYVPSEYALMKGELVRNGDKLFDKFIEENYESY